LDVTWILANGRKVSEFGACYEDRRCGGGGIDFMLALPCVEIGVLGLGRRILKKNEKCNP
jgi:hypothetical protein